MVYGIPKSVENGDELYYGSSNRWIGVPTKLASPLPPPQANSIPPLVYIYIYV
jgi:hypothetical protein